MIKIEICVGSSCHLKGAPGVVEAFQREIQQRGLVDGCDFKLIGSFCQGYCTEGVVVKINEQLFTHVTPEKVNSLLNDYR